MLDSLRKAEGALRTHRVLQRPPSNQRLAAGARAAARASMRGERPQPVAAVTKLELQPLPLSVLDRRAGYKGVPSTKGGIKFHRPLYNNHIVIHENYMILLYLYQLCRYCYSMEDVEAAKQSYYIALRHFLRWRSVLSASKVTKSFWRVISITLRLSERSAKQKGRPLCGTEPRSSLCDDRPLPLGV